MYWPFLCYVTANMLYCAFATQLGQHKERMLAESQPLDRALKKEDGHYFRRICTPNHFGLSNPDKNAKKKKIDWWLSFWQTVLSLQKGHPFLLDGFATSQGEPTREAEIAASSFRHGSFFALCRLGLPLAPLS